MSQMQPGGEQAKKNERDYENHARSPGDRLNAAAWGLIIIWAGLVFFAENMGLVAIVRTGFRGLGEFRLEAWSLIFIGAGVILLLEAVTRTLIPDYRRAIGGTVILGIIFLGIGLGNLISWNIIWPLVLIAIGLLVLARGFLRT